MDEDQGVRDRLVKLGVDVEWIKKNLSNHLRHHWAVQIVLLTFIGGLTTALIISLLSR